MRTPENQNGHKRHDTVGDIVNGQIHIGGGETWPVSGYSNTIGPREGVDEGHRPVPRKPLSEDAFGLIYPSMTLEKAQELAKKDQDRYTREKEKYLQTLGHTAAQGIEVNDQLA